MDHPKFLVSTRKTALVGYQFSPMQSWETKKQRSSPRLRTSIIAGSKPQRRDSPRIFDLTLYRAHGAVALAISRKWRTEAVV
ncbi:uncharacterized protein N7483_003163 [Penicillium malachiteum]|uniref:uncharacterized protein n=1 Tax=Penicillium malachiteum TaxID=1324776 RepID=UPI0025477C0A|nr:uncharacterized protein N7483_003163 [Penicillium malachiteum]KAJ5728655.1 hypothetical protein N7483_003163 [Penicillium malachiteum]